MNLEDVIIHVEKSLNAFKDECSRTSELLNILQRQYKTFLSYVKAIDETDYDDNTDYIDSEREISNLMYNEVVQLNFELERFCRNIGKKGNGRKLSTNYEKYHIPEVPFCPKSSPKMPFFPLPPLILPSISTSPVIPEPYLQKSVPLETKTCKVSEIEPTVDNIQVEENVKDITEKIHKKNKEMEKEPIIEKHLNFEYKSDDAQSVISNGYTKSKKKSETTNDSELTYDDTPKLNSICVVSHVVSPSEFYVAVGNNPFEELHRLNDHIHLRYKDSSSEFKSKAEAETFIINNICVAFSKEFQFWYRAIVVDYKKTETTDLVEVKFVDYGNTELIPFTYLRIIDYDFCTPPPFAKKCHLAYLYPYGSTPTNLLDVWDTKTIDQLKNMLGDNAFFLNFVKKEENSFAVDLLPINSTDRTSVGLYLIDHKFAEEITDQSIPVQIKNSMVIEQVTNALGHNGIEEKMSDTEALEIFFKNSATINEPGNINEAVIDYEPQDEKRICRLMLAHGYCTRRVCAFEHTKIPKGAITTDKSPTYIAAENDLLLPNEGDNIRLKITCVKDACNFYANLEHNPKDLHKEMTLDVLSRLMNQKKIIKKYKKISITPSISQIILVYCDLRWCRGKIIDYAPDDSNAFKIFLVDFGDEIIAGLTDLREIMPDFLQLPFQALSCSICNVSLKSNEDIDEGKRFFESHYLSENLQASVISRGLNTIRVILYDLDGEDIGSKLIDEGYVVLNNDLLESKNSILLVD